MANLHQLRLANRIRKLLYSYHGGQHSWTYAVASSGINTDNLSLLKELQEIDDLSDRETLVSYFSTRSNIVFLPWVNMDYWKGSAFNGVFRSFTQLCSGDQFYYAGKYYSKASSRTARQIGTNALLRINPLHSVTKLVNEER